MNIGGENAHRSITLFDVPDTPARVPSAIQNCHEARPRPSVRGPCDAANAKYTPCASDVALPERRGRSRGEAGERREKRAPKAFHGRAAAAAMIETKKRRKSLTRGGTRGARTDGQVKRTEPTLSFRNRNEVGSTHNSNFPRSFVLKLELIHC